MQSKLFSAAILFICFATKGNAQNEIQHFKLNPAPFRYKYSPIIPKSFHSIPNYRPYQNKVLTDSSKFIYKTDLGDIYNSYQDGMPILKPNTTTTNYEKNRTLILTPLTMDAFGKPSIIEPMPNPLNRALIFEDKL